MTNDLTAAVAQVKGWTPKDETWEFSDFRPENGRMPIAMAKTVATILNAVAFRELVPAADVQGLVEALTPSGDTKAAYMGEIKDPETKRLVSWTAIKMIMAMISARAAIKEDQ